jgi:transcriptional regulator of arginine metabolism
MLKKERQQKLLDLIRIRSIANQHDLLEELAAVGIQANQASISRDLNELGISKVHGIYGLPQIRAGESLLTEFLEIDTAGDHLLVLKTLPGKANSVAISLDNLKLPEIVGTLAGDDTIFIATKGAAEQKGATKKIIKHFKLL